MALLSDKTLEACKNADAILLGAIGGPKWTNPNNRPEHGLLKLRKSLIYTQISVLPLSLRDKSPFSFKRERVKGTDLVIVKS